MKIRFLLTISILALTNRSDAQSKVRISAGEVTSPRVTRVDLSRLAQRIPSVEPERRRRLLVSGDSAQRIAMSDYAWNGRVSSVEIDEVDARLFWDVKIVPDSSQQTIVRYRIDATSGGILSIKEFGGILGLARKP